jgi:ADP-heptose:LPS heptosyltransferase
VTTPTALVLRALGLGDFFTGLPALALLRSARPDWRIVVAAPLVLEPLFRLAGTVDHVVPGAEALTPLTAAPERPELAVDLHGNGPRSRRVLLARRPGRLIAFGHDGIRWRDDEHEAARWCRLVREGLGLPDGTEFPSVIGALPQPQDVDVPAGLTLLHCGAKSAARRWPAERFAALAILLRTRGHDVVVTGGPGERGLAEAIAAAGRVSVLHDLTLVELAAVIARARLVVCGDTGVGHVATNYRTPSVLLFGPVAPAVWGPPPHPRHQVLWHGTGGGNPHANTPDPALLEIDVHEAAEAVDRAMTGAGVGELLA